MSAKILYDERCHELALYFLQDSKHTDQDVADFACEIQETCEDFMNAFEAQAARRAT